MPQFMSFDSGESNFVLPSARRRESVKLILIGKPEPVTIVIASLQVKGFTDAGNWSRPLQPPETTETLARSVGEVMRVYKHYVSL
jgi:hypothetical protein